MVDRLFKTTKQNTFFCDLLAARMLKNSRKARVGYEEETKAALNICGDILFKYGAPRNYIAELDAIQNEIEKAEQEQNPVELEIRPKFSDNYRSSLPVKDDVYAKKDALTDEYAEFVKGIPLEVSEDLDFYAGQIGRRRILLSDTLATEENILRAYPNADTLEFKSAFEELENIFIEISHYTKEEFNIASLIKLEDAEEKAETEKVVEAVLAAELPELAASPEVEASDPEIIEPAATLPEPELELKEEPAAEKAESNMSIFDVNRRKVKRIKKASKTLLDNVTPLKTESPKLELEAEEVFEAKPSITDSFAISEELNPFLDVEEVKAVAENLLEEVPAVKLDKLPEVAVAEEITPSINVDMGKILEFKPPVVAEASKELEVAAEVENPFSADVDNGKVLDFKPKDEDKVMFEMQSGMSLADLALALYDDVNGWMDIYYANKEKVDQLLIEKNYSNLGELETDKELFAGLKLEIPTTFNEAVTKGIDESSQGMSIAA